MAAELIRHSAEFVWQQAISIVESAQYNSAESAHAADNSHKLFYIMPLKLVASEHGLHLAGNRSGEGNNQHVSPAQRHKTQQKAALTRFLLNYVLQST